MPQISVPTKIAALHIVLGALFVFVATLMTFVNAANADFVNWDDDVYILANPNITSLTVEHVLRMFTSPHALTWNPVTSLSHALDISFWGLSPKGHHMTNVFLHSMNGMFFFIVSLIFFGVARAEAYFTRDWTSHVTASVFVGSLIGALLYATHPLRVESVVWVSGRKDLLTAFFLLPAFGSYLLWKLRRGESALLVTHIGFVLALLSSPTAAMFPIILILVDVLWMKEHAEDVNLIDRFISGKLLLVAFTVGAIVVRVSFGSGTGDHVVSELNLFERLILPLKLMVFYLWKILVPLKLSPIYPVVRDALFFISSFIVVILVYGCFKLAGRQHFGAAFAFFAYLVMLFPMLIGQLLGVSPPADRYTYITTTSVFMFVGGVSEWLWRKSSQSLGRFYQRESIFLVLFVVVGISAYRTLRHVAIWDNSVSLWTQALRYAPTTREEYESGRPYTNPNFMDAYIKLAEAYHARGSAATAIQKLNTALMLDPRSASVHYHLGKVYEVEGRIELAKRGFQNAISNDPHYGVAYLGLGSIYARQDSVELATECFHHAARLGEEQSQRILREQGLTW